MRHYVRAWSEMVRSVSYDMLYLLLTTSLSCISATITYVGVAVVNPKLTHNPENLVNAVRQCRSFL